MEKVYKLKNGKKIGIYHLLWSLLLLLLPAVNVNAQTYCAAANTDANGLGSYMSNVTYGTINNTTGNVYAINGYTYFSGQTTTVILGSTQPLSVTISTGTNYSGAIVSVWFDWNQDGTFSASEWTQVSTNVLAGATATVSITVPATALPGTTRMRVRSRGSGNQNGSADACLSMGSGDTEDYDIIVSAGTPCTGTPTAGTIAPAVPDSICPNVAFALSTVGTTIGTGMTYQWEQSATGLAGSWTNIAGATNLGYAITAGITTPTFYRLKSTCNTGTPVYSNEKQIFIKPILDCYCTPTAGTSSTSYYVSALTTTGGATNLNYTASSYVPYVNAIATQEVSQFPGQSFNTTITISGSGTHYYQAWIDWNSNGSFGDPGENVFSITTYTASPISFTVNVPGTQAVGNYRMRVTSDWLGNATNSAYCGPIPYGNFVDVNVSVIPLQPCTAITYPTNVVATAFPDNLCLTGNSTLSINNNFILATGQTFQWQSSPTGAVWTDIAGATNQTYTATGISATTHYRFLVKCNGSTVVTSAPDTVIINSPGSVTGTPASRCGPGQVQLGATPVNAGNGVVWYQNASGGLPLGIGTNFTTQYLTNTTTFYAAASSAATAPTPPTWIGNGTTTISGNPNPFYTNWWGLKNQYLIKASELTASGLTAGTITEIAFDVVANSGMAMNGLYFSMKQTNLTTLSTTWETGLTNVYTAPAAFMPTANSVNAFTLQTPFVWDGVSNIIIESCFNNSAYSSGHSVKYTTNLGFNATHYVQADNATVCSAPGTGSTLTSRPNIRFSITAGCQGPRIPIVATINTGSPVTKTSAPVICNNSVTPITVTLPTNGQYVPYKFYPNTNLFTDAAATTPYTGTAATTVYFRSATSGNHTIYAIGGDTTVAGASTSCSRADTFNIWVQPATNTIKGMPDTICVSGTSKLTLQTDTNFYPGSIQWQESTNGGTTYNNITGANGVSYTTATLSAARHYRAVISAGSSVCYNVDKQVLVVSPVLASTQGGAHCGPGPVTMSAVPGTNAVIRWYENPTGGQPLAQGNTYTTPNLSTTTTYYVAAGTGAPPSQPTWVGTGTTSNTTPNPFYTGWWGSKNQFLIRASEMTAAGLSAGPINSISFQTTGSFAMNLTNYTVKMATTTLTAMPAAYQTGLTTVFTAASYTPVLGLNTHTLTTPFAWDGVSNIIIETCYNNSAYSSGFNVVSSSYSYNATYYGYGDIATVCSGTPTYNYTSTSRPNIRFDIPSGCETARVPVVASINPFPIVDLGTDLDTCVDIGLSFTVDAAPQPNNATYLWDDNTTNSTRLINQSGIYHVAVTNQFGCTTNDTLNIAIKDNPVVNLAASGVNLCEGGTKVLDAGPDGENGGSYYWSNGATSRTITVNNAGEYIVYVTNTEGCLQVDTVNIVVTGHMPAIDGITSTAVSPTSFSFNAVNPQNVVEYIWIIGNDTINTGSNPTLNPPYQFPGNGNYWVKLLTNSICGQVSDSIMVTIIGVGINDVDNNLNVKVYPNPTKGETVTLETEGDIRINEVNIYNIIGQEVYSNKNLKGNNSKYEIKLGSHLAPGVYNIRMQTNKGLVNRKMEILK